MNNLDRILIVFISVLLFYGIDSNKNEIENIKKYIEYKEDKNA